MAARRISHERCVAESKDGATRTDGKEECPEALKARPILATEAVLMRIIDFDLDAFLDKVAYGKKGRRRLNKKRYTPWSADQLRHFLEEKCKLTRQSPIPGRFMIEHDGAYDYFEQLAKETGEKLDITHVDAHADLGNWGLSWKDIVGSLLHQPLAERIPSREPGRLDATNYLAYALAAGLVSHLTYVHHPDGGDDCVPNFYFRNNDPLSGYIEMRAYSESEIKKSIQTMEALAADKALRFETPVAFSKISTALFETPLPFSSAVLCQSPAYTPRTADLLIPVFLEYICFDGPVLKT
jgi:hypothetical protein